MPWQNPRAQQEAQVDRAYDIPPPPATAPSKELLDIHDRPQSALPPPHNAEDFVTPKDKIMYGTSLMDPITLDHLKDIADIEKRSDVRSSMKPST
jgi:hypothetical protein